MSQTTPELNFKQSRKPIIKPLLALLIVFCLMIVLISSYGIFNHHVFADKASLLHRKWSSYQKSGMPKSKISTLKQKLDKLENEKMGPFSVTWFPKISGSEQQIKQLQSHTEKLWTQTKLIDKKRASIALESLMKTKGSHFSNKKHDQLAFKGAKSPKDFNELTQKWTAERNNWLASQSKLTKLSGGMIDGKPADIVQGIDQLKTLLKKLPSTSPLNKKGKQTLAMAQQFENQTIPDEADHHEDIKKSLESTIASIKKAEVPVETILNIPLINQMAAPKLYNGCEITSLDMVLQFEGFEISKQMLANEIPKVPLTYKNGLRGNPNIGFVGSISGSSAGLSVYHEPIAKLAEKYAGARVEDLTGDQISEIYKKIKQGIPVWVITTANFSPVGNLQTWDTPQGKVKVTFDEHSVVITGYSEQYVYINNPYGFKNEKINREEFEESWVQMGRQAVVINPKTKKPL